MIKRLLIYVLILSLIIPMFSCGSGRRRDIRTDRIESVENVGRNRRQSRPAKGKSVIKMQKDGGVYHIPCKINGTEMEFIFDTGASDITMSLTEALFLYKQGKMSEDDFLGTQEYQIADGSISEGTIVNLKTVTIGNRTLENIQASIVHNLDAPLLLGQSALAKFGNISIDYNKNEITFE